MTDQSLRNYTDSVQYLPSLGIDINLINKVRQNEGCGCSGGDAGCTSCDLYVNTFSSKIDYRKKR